MTQLRQLKEVSVLPNSFELGVKPHIIHKSLLPDLSISIWKWCLAYAGLVGHRAWNDESIFC